MGEQTPEEKIEDGAKCYGHRTPPTAMTHFGGRCRPGRTLSQSRAVTSVHDFTRERNQWFIKYSASVSLATSHCQDIFFMYHRNFFHIRPCFPSSITVSKQCCGLALDTAY